MTDGYESMGYSYLHYRTWPERLFSLPWRPCVRRETRLTTLGRLDHECRLVSGELEAMSGVSNIMKGARNDRPMRS